MSYGFHIGLKLLPLNGTVFLAEVTFEIGFIGMSKGDSSDDMYTPCAPLSLFLCLYEQKYKSVTKR